MSALARTQGSGAAPSTLQHRSMHIRRSWMNSKEIDRSNVRIAGFPVCSESDELLLSKTCLGKKKIKGKRYF
jgi:hypothetical protein